MRNTSWINNILVAFIGTVSISHVTTNSIYAAPQVPSAVASGSMDQFVDSLYDQVLSDFRHIRSSVELMAHILNSGEVHGIDVKNVGARLSQVNNLILQVPHSIKHPDIHAVVALIDLEGALLAYLLDMINSDFEKTKPFDPSALIKRKPNAQNITAEKIQRSIINNQRLAQKLAKVSGEIGLKWYNKAFRKLDAWVIQPADKYRVVSRTMAAGLAGFIGLYLWRWFDYDSFEGSLKDKNYLRGMIYKLYGPLDQTHQSMGLIDAAENFKNLGPVGKIENLLRANAGSATLLLGGAFVLFWGHMKQEWQELSVRMHKKWSVLSNKLKGGAYLKEAIKKNVDEIEPVYFDELVGLDNVKHVFQQIVDYLENPERFDRIGSKPPKGILLIGDTRTGKSFSVKALFSEVRRMLKRFGRDDQFKLLEVRASDVNEMGIGGILTVVKHAAPCILFIDEIDLLDLQRRGKNDRLSDFLKVMGETLTSYDSGKQVFIIGATNRPEALDKALRAPGRFGKILNYVYPCFEERRVFIVRKLKNLSLLDTKMFDIDRFAYLTEKKSFEDLNTLIDTAVLNAHIRREGLTQKHLEETLNEEVRRVVTRGDQNLSKAEKEIIAAHYAGKALILHLLNTKLRLADVTIRPVITDIHEQAMGSYLFEGKGDDPKEETRLEHGRVFTYHEFDTIDMNNRADKLALCQFYLAGFEAEEMLIGSCGYSCNNIDSNRSVMTAQSLAFQGLEVSRIPKYLQKEMFEEAMKIREACRKEVRALLEKHKDALKNIQRALIKHETLSAQQVIAIIGGDLSLVEDPKPIVTETDNEILVDVAPVKRTAKTA